MAMATRTPPAGPAEIPVTLPTIAPRILTSAPLGREPPASRSCAETCSGPPMAPVDRRNVNVRSTPPITIATRPRRASSRRVSSLRTFCFIGGSPRDPEAGVTAPEEQRHDHVEQDDRDDARADGAAGRLTDRL